MSNKQQLQTNNIDLSTILTTIGDLPIRALVEAAARQGEYVWKRYEIPAPLAVASKSSSGNYIVITLDSSQDLSGVSEQSLDGATITLTETNGYECVYTLKYDNGSKTADCSDDTYDTNYSYSAGVLKLGALAYLFPNATCSDITMPTSSDYVFVVSNTESAYPDGGTQDGYYYERVSEGVTGIDFGTVTPTSAVTSIKVNHTLGVVPSYAIIVKKTAWRLRYTDDIVLAGSSGFVKDNTLYSPNVSGSSEVTTHTATSSQITFKNTASETYGKNIEYIWFAIA